MLRVLSTAVLLVITACSTPVGQQLKEYRLLYQRKDFSQAKLALEKTGLSKDKKNALLWVLEKGTLALATSDFTQAISSFQEAIELVDKLFTIKISSKASSFLINDASDDFYGASFERSFAHYFLAKSYYLRYLQSQNKQDLLSARASILAWDSYFSSLQRSVGKNILYSTDLVLKIFGAQIHEVSDVKHDQEISLQLYQDALRLLKTYGGIFAGFNKNHQDYINYYKDHQKPSLKLYQPTIFHQDLSEFLIYKILALTQQIRSSVFKTMVKKLNPTQKTLQKLNESKANTVILFEEGLIPRKIPRVFNYGLKNAFKSTKDPGVRSFISQVGTELLASFALSTLGLRPKKLSSRTSQQDLILSSTVNKVAAFEAAVQFELPVLEKTKTPDKLDFFIVNQENKEVASDALPVISFNAEVAQIVLEEDVLKRYLKTGFRVASKHLAAIVLAMQVHRRMNQSQATKVWANSAALATYVGASKGLSLLEKADTRQWMTLPATLRMTELYLPPGEYQLGVRSHQKSQKIIRSFKVTKGKKTIHNFSLF